MQCLYKLATKYDKIFQLSWYIEILYAIFAIKMYAVVHFDNFASLTAIC